MHKVYKRGDKREDGMVFWSYHKGFKSGERWVTDEKFKTMQDLRTNSHHRRKTIHKNKGKKLSCGDIGNNGMIFWAYNQNCKNGEWWITPEKYKEKQSSVLRYQKEKRKNDKMFKFINNIRALVGISIRNGGYTKNTKTAKILGCTYEKFKKHIESQFTSDMSWENQGDWHLDHRLPVSAARNKEEIIKLNHYTNFQPLWAKDNLTKSDKYNPKELKDYLSS